MPHLIFNGVKKEDVQTVSKNTQFKLAEICNTTPTNFIFDYIESTWYLGGDEMSKYPLIEIKMFDRGREVEKNMYRVISGELEKLGYEDIELYIIHLQKESYFY